MSKRGKAKEVKEEGACCPSSGSQRRGGEDGERGTAKVEDERLGGEKVEKGGKMNEDIGGPLSQVTQGMVGIHFLLLFFRNAENVNERSGSLNDDLDPLAFLRLSCSRSARGPIAVPPWPGVREH
jgi:hypothetical protein